MGFVVRRAFRALDMLAVAISVSMMAVYHVNSEAGAQRLTGGDLLDGAAAPTTEPSSAQNQPIVNKVEAI